MMGGSRVDWTLVEDVLTFLFRFKEYLASCEL
jgi:hypothetical protein